MSTPENTQKRPAEDTEDQNVEVKRVKAEEIAPSNTPSLTDHLNAPHRTIPNPVSKMGLVPAIPELPPSLKMVTGIEADMVARRGFVGEEECGIRGFVGKGKGVRGVIKQRFTDFLVNEIGLDGEVLHLKDISKPQEPGSKEKDKEAAAVTEEEAANDQTDSAIETAPQTEESEATVDLPENLRFAAHPQWSTSTTLKLRPHFTDETIISLHQLVEQGKDAPPKGDSGWGGRKKDTGSASEEIAKGEEEKEEGEEAAFNDSTNKGRGQGRDRGRGRGKDRGRGRGGRGGRGGGRNADSGSWWLTYEDEREVLSQPVTSKEERAAAHKVLREVFPGMFESSTREVKGEEGQRLVIKWSSGGAQSSFHGKGARRAPDAPRLPAYIHFTLHKSNRETMDALSHLQRLLNVQAKDLTVCGTKDKRAVTVQRVCLKRSGRNLQTVWRALNGVKQGWRTEQQAVEERGDRGVRVGDFEYSDKYLELGMLKGNRFLITLRNVEAENVEEIDRTMESVRDLGFINFYGMQRFGTSSMPTHVTGLFILRSNWSAALDSLLSLREGEHPDCVAARLSWLEDGDYVKALEKMPRRAVAERSIWEFWKRGGRMEDKVGALGVIPRNLRTMYVHAYQSYVWNLIVSERIKMSATEPFVGDLVIEKSDDDEPIDPENVPAHRKDRHGRTKSWKTSSSPTVRRLTAEDITNKTHTIFDVVMPLPGFDVDYPGGEVGELYDRILKADGLDKDRMRREQREYSLPGSYRLILLRPLSLTWTHLQYTDPDLPLVQSDEDEILSLNPPAANDPEGKFRAVKVDMQLGASTYATMVLREITREETSSWFQRGRTMKGEDQEFKGIRKDGEGQGEEGEGGEMELMNE
ncbi:tRNA pseudouridine13 synthase [Cryptococcus neoformans C23]|uniref:tRNA pseudouridine13 synthase n=2 Tax=Cryptococcus neoformans TaxID=5207 RepID=A0A854QC51_CRYNE|nr:tRNA pseudouridine13 synthase [Cryptococcus neoformans var. grubii H99]AUB24192.1 tRNA pseudouridine13 synthase [Cryptococcus neoformans var. grubii]OWT40239.1 tRNA pseudouridine13 synthase [Cryptococcus neoformans var. grubii Bt1]OWZ32884.1 tRNA pseudouridine13 synthase [Cryptococcus neoformans var. grubii AD2-60a]OWZ44995.1 tRNA pseudouridine13 synthase [Cryptococcus neoformans var. grubii C23]OWZ45867.1 tRNA pseudouridine13 synthase [Cryptococcus neoformans var. grubii AD1-83a]OWZ54880.|eukprot:XP_012048818.1 tRNA pseudouridine13 synthase [Cryptococcus neoformans var. grubii H99]